MGGFVEDPPPGPVWTSAPSVDDEGGAPGHHPPGPVAGAAGAGGLTRLRARPVCAQVGGGPEDLEAAKAGVGPFSPRGGAGRVPLLQRVRELGRTGAIVACLTFLTSSQGILIQVSKSAGKFDYSVTTANCMVEVTKCLISLATLARQWSTIGVNDDNRLQTTLQEVWVFPIPAFLYLIKNLMQYFIFLYVDAPSYQVLKNLNIISTGVLYRIFMQKELSAIQWIALILLTMGCTTSQLSSSSDEVLSTPFMGVVLAIVMALLSGAAGVYTELIIKKRPQRSINVQNFCARGPSPGVAAQRGR